ncbi:hypothetical protein FCR2A7T_15460 [Flavobacterium cauense R2A-7]|uniref:Carbohydrate binding protein with CBM9 domain n=1 Tax=Flavobacterium cauense R2A-7 TaxID=1341154 RepID=V6S6X4_9FLAO|nr:DUF5916 domain-containing protein [Flavobacterium cauense]ESU20135.1 hypothetical protein FCR2A7T_15460 [Flavobacterium cauense R2A-7]KGO83936.1 hydrolase [Flavobacterium cauense R2A-7]TWI14726.1 carbohydrate binding protein with CBM9 domain [Flavobacterium cauense R2A-7]
MNLKLSLVVSFICTSIGFSQESISPELPNIAAKKTLTVLRTDQTVTIDGKLDEPFWKNAQTATDFVMFQPDNGKPELKNEKSIVRVAYDNDGIYIGAELYQDSANMLKEITQRDNFGTSDHFGIFLNGYNDGQQDFRLIVSAAGTQMDCIATQENGEDYSWDGIWYSAVKMTDFGWTVEMKIPYAAIRFSKKDKQVWGVNFFREVRYKKQKYAWNKIDANIGNIMQQAGVLTGIENIKPPTRLFLIPYASGYVNQNKEGTETTLKGGMDIKYGINDSFTLDAILVPDFGQTVFDNKILNLGPFEQQLNENRAFFTEGTDLFNKGGLFYSRRIGSKPSGKVTLNENESVQEEPGAINLLNALKVSGRTSKGLGIGILNAVTEKTEVSIVNNVTGETRNEVVEPLANYNVLVFDQRFRKNSSVSFVNTSVMRNGSYRDANASALLFDLNTKANTYKLSGNFKYSTINDIEDKNGFSSNLYIAKTFGKYRFSGGGNYVSKDFNINDMGINFTKNYHNFFGNFSYRILNPTKTFNSFYYNANSSFEWQNETGKLQNAWVGTSINFSNKKNDDFGIGLDFNPIETYDFYQPRTANRYVYRPKNYGGWFYVSTNYNNPFAFDFNPYFYIYDQTKRNSYGFSAGPRFRLSDKLFLSYGINFARDNNDKGFVDKAASDIIFANRNVTTIENSVSGKYAINSQMTFNMKVRYYWSYSEIKNYLTLLEDGYFAPNTTYDQNNNDNFKSWNYDLSYTWWFAPGSQISVLYRNNAIHYEQRLNKNIIDNLAHTLENDLNHTFSVSVKYLIDYNKAKNWL